ncbi:GNAT family N-acetyltransferase [Streptomyces sp. NPDC092296]|uniref:GNAT family N-acetyltransferase n=1 Tax=Streptomyces sp. NPDC092296 TaxID=3366012 RepID=UPI00382F8F6A
MTTTLRPAAPEEPLPGGGRTRHYHVCANGRPIGTLRLSAHATGPRPTGEIAGLEITEGRRRGRGTVAVLAAEEVLRGWGCTRVDATVPEDAAEALRLAAALGYQERMRSMAKRLPTGPPQLPAGLVERPIDAAAFPDWIAVQEQGYAQSLVDSGLSPEHARRKSAADHQALLPDGVDSPDTALRFLAPADPPEAPPLGSLWVQLRGRSLPGGGRLAWVLSVEVAEGSRGHGYGRALMLLAERCCLAVGVHDLGLNVFAGNEVARGLYTSLGYRTLDRTLGKALL